MAHSSSRPHTTVALPDNELDVLRCTTCPMCHTPTSMTQNAIEAGGYWRCVRCGQRWDAARLAAVAACAGWTVDHDQVDRRGTDGSHDTALYRDSPTERLGGNP